MTSHREAWQQLNKLYLVLEKNNLLDPELRNYIWDLEDYIKICESEEDTKDIIYNIKDEVNEFIETIKELIDMLWKLKWEELKELENE